MKTILPKSMSIYLTYKCQLRCEYCFLTQSGLLNNYSLETDEVLRVIDDAYNHNVFMIIISGGDPFLHPDIFKILGYIVNKNMLPLIASSGVDITDMRLIRLKEIGVSCIQVGLDGASEKENDLVKGEETFNRIDLSIERIQRYGLNANLAVTVSNKNFDGVLYAISYAFNKKIFRLKINFWKPYRESETYGYKELSEEQKNAVVNACRKYMNELNCPGWITIPGYDVSTEKKLGYGKYPPLSVGADGSISLGEFGESVGHIRTHLPSDVYSKNVREIKTEILSAIVEWH